MAALGKALEGAGKKIGGAIKTATSTKPGKTIATGAAVGGAVALTGAGAGIGLSAVGKGVDQITGTNPFNGIIKLINPDATDEQARAAGSLIGIAIIVGLVLLAVFVIIPQFNKSKKGGK